MRLVRTMCAVLVAVNGGGEAEESFTVSHVPVPEWLDRISTDPPEARVSRLPTAQDVGLPVTAQLIIELLSR